MNSVSINNNSANLIEQMKRMIAQAEGAKSTEPSQDTFGATFQQALSQVNALNENADSLKARFEMGDPGVSLADAMIAGQKSALGFQGALMVRNKVVQAYQDVMSMSV